MQSRLTVQVSYFAGLRSGELQHCFLNLLYNVLEMGLDYATHDNSIDRNSKKKISFFREKLGTKKKEQPV